MHDHIINEPMLEMYIFETAQMLDQLEQIIMRSEKKGSYDQDAINEIFRFMHTIKGSSAMMLFNNIGTLAHSIEDLFYFLREQKPKNVDCSSLSDLVLEALDFIKIEVEKIKSGDKADGESTLLIEHNKGFLQILKEENGCVVDTPLPPSKKKQQYYIAPEKKIEYAPKYIYHVKILFTEDCGMESIRAYTVVHSLADLAEEIHYIPEDISDNDDSTQQIKEQGFEIYLKSNKDYEQIEHFFKQTVFLKSLEVSVIDDIDVFKQFEKPKPTVVETPPVKLPQIESVIAKDKDNKDTSVQKEQTGGGNQGMISVNVGKLDRLMDLVGEMVIAEAMVTQNPEIENLHLENFQKSARLLHKITEELQDMVMSIRMVPLSTTFMKMHRIMRDMCKKLGKEVELDVIGEETEVDKNIIERISDPLMHLIRNSIDHGIEDVKEREKNGKSRIGKVTLEAKNSGSDVLVIIKDDGRGLNKEKILAKALANGLLDKQESEVSEREIYNLILLPGFSTKENITEFSGRGVGMDVVLKNLEAVGGTVSVDSVEGKGTTITMKIPLTLAIIDGMNIRVGQTRYTVPIISIKESFRPGEEDCFTDPDDNEMIMVRGQCYPILRLHEYYSVKTEITKFHEGILIMVEQDNKSFCIFADELLGQQQVVVKALPQYIKSMKRIEGLAGCTLLGDGSISLILDVLGLGKMSNVN